MKRIAMLTSQRSEEEKERRRKYGDKGARFKSGKLPKVDLGGVVGTITTMVTKDLRIIEYYEEDSVEHGGGGDMPDSPGDLLQGGVV